MNTHPLSFRAGVTTHQSPKPYSLYPPAVPCLCGVPRSSSAEHGAAACSRRTASLRPAYAGPRLKPSLRNLPTQSCIAVVCLCKPPLELSMPMLSCAASYPGGRVMHHRPSCMKTENPPQLDSWHYSPSPALQMILSAVSSGITCHVITSGVIGGVLNRRDPTDPPTKYRGSLYKRHFLRTIGRHIS